MCQAAANSLVAASICLPVQQLIGPLFSGEQPPPDVTLLAQRPDNSHVNFCRIDGALRGTGKAGDPLLPIRERSPDHRSRTRRQTGIEVIQPSHSGPEPVLFKPLRQDLGVTRRRQERRISEQPAQTDAERSKPP